jgi:hypothetical protein
MILIKQRVNKQGTRHIVLLGVEPEPVTGSGLER